MTPLRITVAIATYNRADLLRQTLAGVVQQDLPSGTYDVIVIDNNSRDHTARVTAGFPTVRYVHEPRQGLSCARNRAIAESHADIVVFADDDILVERDWLQQLIAPFLNDSDRRIGAVGGEVIPVFPSGVPNWVAGWHGPLALRADAGPLPPRQFPMGANLAIRRDVFVRVGTFNESLGRQGARLMGGEETEFLRRVRAAGLEVWFAPAAKVLHQLPSSRTTFRYNARHAFDSARSRVIERAGEPNAARYLISRFAGNLVKAPAFALLGGLRALTFQGGKSKKALVRAWRSCGYVYQIARLAAGRRS